MHDVHSTHSTTSDVEKPLILVGEVSVEPDLGILLLDGSEQVLDDSGSVRLGLTMDTSSLEICEGSENGRVESRWS